MAMGEYFDYVPYVLINKLAAQRINPRAAIDSLSAVNATQAIMLSGGKISKFKLGKKNTSWKIRKSRARGSAA